MPHPTDALQSRARACLAEADPDAKCALTDAAFGAWRAGVLAVTDAAAPVPVDRPGRPDRPALVPPRRLARRGLGSVAGRVALIHAVAHIEFNAINLAWDAVQRFPGLPDGFYGDWARVAAEEARHFRLLRGRLRDLGHDYGDLPAHDGLWEMARETAHDPLVRMALVPRVLEARGLDVTPGMIERLRAAGDAATVAVLEVILAEEEGHVAIGSHWFRWLCEQRGLEPQATFLDLLARHLRAPIKGPLHEAARRRAGFTDAELAALARLD